MASRIRISPDNSIDEFKKIIKNDWPALTESDTRAKIIDPILTKCMNWKEINISREPYSDGSYIDYVLKLRDKNILIIEAKSNGVSFEIPVTFGNRRQYKMNHVLSSSPNIHSAISQAQKYCFKKGVRYGAITNGSQFIFFEAYKLGEDWEKCNCIVFYNFDDILRDYVKFWNILSKDAVEKNALVDNISKESDELFFNKALDGIRYRNENQPRNTLHRYFTPIINYVFKEITEEDRRELMEKCYILDSAFKDANYSLKKYFSDSVVVASKKHDFKTIIQTKDTAGNFLRDYYKYSTLLYDGSPEPIVFLLLGRIGSGKTTFIYRFFNYVLSDTEKNNVLWFIINFRDAPLSEGEIRNYIFENILKELYKKYRGIYEEIIEEHKDDSILKDPNYMSVLFAILKSKGYYTALVIDNVDQHKSSSPIFHEKIFIESNNITKELRSLTIITLREESFYKSSIEGVFDAYYTEGYEISPPDFRSLILKRLDFVLEKLRLPLPDIQTLLKTRLNYESNITDVIDFLQVVRDSIYNSDKRGISAFISHTSGANMRRALELFSQFLISGNTKVDEILNIYRDTGSYQIAYHQLIKSIILGNHRFYSADTSYLMNILDFNIEFSNSNFLRLKILSYSEENLSSTSPFGQGYISINNIINEAEDIKISYEAITDSLFQLARYGLIVLDTKSRSSLDGASYFKITGCGSYYLHVLINRFPYLDLIWVDTPIADIDLVRDLRRYLNDTGLNRRFERTELFIDYLVHLEEREMQLNPEYKQSKLGNHTYALKIKKSYEYQKKYILKRLKDKQWYFY